VPIGVSEPVVDEAIKGDAMLEQTTRILVGGSAPQAYQRHVRNEWGPLREQVYGRPTP